MKSVPRVDWQAGGDHLKRSGAFISAGVGLPLVLWKFVQQWQMPGPSVPVWPLVGSALTTAGLLLFPAITQKQRRQKMLVGGGLTLLATTLTAGHGGLAALSLLKPYLGHTAALTPAMQFTTLAFPMTWAGALTLGILAEQGRRYIRRGRKDLTDQPEPSHLVLGKQWDDPEEDVMLLESDRYMHLVVIGPTGSGKTASFLSPLMVQDLANPKVGATVIEPKGDWILGDKGVRPGIKQWAEQLERTVYVIDPDNENTDVYNPLYGDMHMVAESITMALRSLFQTKASFFADVQESLLKHTIYLLKWLKGDNLTFRDLHRTVGDYSVLLSLTQELAARYMYWKNAGFPTHITEDDQEEILKLIEWFNRETDGKAGEKLKEVTLGIRVQLDNMMANAYFRRCILPPSQAKKDAEGRIIGGRVIDLDRHLANNSVLCVSTNDGLLAGMSQVLGKLVLTALQYAASRRFKQLPEKRRPHTIYVDEAATYLTESWGEFQAKARGFNISIVLALQTMFQLEKVQKGFTQTIIGNARNRVLFGGLPREDIEYWMGAFGTRQELEVSYQSNERTMPIPADSDPLYYILGYPKQFGSGKGERMVEKDLLAFNELFLLQRGEAIVQMVVGGSVTLPQKVRVGVVKELPRRLPGATPPPEAGLAQYAGPLLPEIPPKAQQESGAGGGPGRQPGVAAAGHSVVARLGSTPASETITDQDLAELTAELEAEVKAKTAKLQPPPQGQKRPRPGVTRTLPAEEEPR